MRLARRTLIAAAPSLVLATRAMAAMQPTPAQTEGPFYPRILPVDRDADLTSYEGGRPRGEVIEMTGVVFDTKGAPVAGGEVEIWHCDAEGHYAHVGASSDPHFQGWGIVRTVADGAYRFRTIKPGLYPGRTRHIHVKARLPGATELTTQMYFPDEPGNAGDMLLRRAPRAEALVARLEMGEVSRFLFDIVLG